MWTKSLKNGLFFLDHYWQNWENEKVYNTVMDVRKKLGSFRSLFKAMSL